MRQLKHRYFTTNNNNVEFMLNFFACFLIIYTTHDMSCLDIYLATLYFVAGPIMQRNFITMI